MTRRSRTLAAMVSAALVSAPLEARAAEANEAALRVCLNENEPPLSLRDKDGGVGFDVMIAEELARRLGRRFEAQWYESKLDENSDATIEANALLSDGRCDLVAGFPLTREALGKPGVETAKMPDFAGAKAADRRRRVTLGALAATTPYSFDGFAVVLGPGVKDKRIGGLADLDGLNLTIESGTLGDAILMTYDHGRFISHIAHSAPGRGEVFPRLERGEADATLAPVHRFDAYRIAHPGAKLALSGYFLPVGFNMGFVGLATDPRLIEEASAAIEAMLKDGEPVAAAQASRLTYLPPRRPYVQDGFKLSDLNK